MPNRITATCRIQLKIRPPIARATGFAPLTSEQIVPAIDKLLARCHEEDATLLLVDFSQAFGWRRHGALYDRLRDESLSITLEPEPVEVDGALFDPVGHFRSWRDLQDAFIAEKPDRKAAIAAAIQNSGTQGSPLAKQAAALNRQSIKTPTGKRWTEDNLRKFLKAM